VIANPIQGESGAKLLVIANLPPQLKSKALEQPLIQELSPPIYILDNTKLQDLLGIVSSLAQAPIG
jgi:hypothetical protein